MFRYALQLQDTRTGKWMLALGICFCALALTYWPNGLPYFRYEHAAIASGQAWRLVTGHFVHLNGAHLAVNVLGLFLICELLWGDMPIVHGCGLLGGACAGVSGLLWLLHPDLAWYAGMSGVLHGLWAGCALAGLWSWSGRAERCARGYRTVCCVGLLLLIAKLGMEFLHGPSADTAQVIGAPVVGVAHFYGALTGGFYVLIWHGVRLLHPEK